MGGCVCVCIYTQKSVKVLGTVQNINWSKKQFFCQQMPKLTLDERIKKYQDVKSSYF